VSSVKFKSIVSQLLDAADGRSLGTGGVTLSIAISSLNVGVTIDDYCNEVKFNKNRGRLSSNDGAIDSL
jgi:hypothetical protein